MIPNDNKIMVSICCLAFNHEKFIRQALDGFIMQQTNFPFEIVIHDDASTDNTANIIKEYEAKYPNLFNALYQSVNQKSIYKSGINPRFNYPRAKGKYIALCEGDDYWTDPYKLQKQVDFLEANPDFNLCFTKSNQLINGDKLELKKIPDISSDGIYTYNDLLQHYNFITTASVVFRKNFNNIPSWIYQLPYGDMGLYCLVSRDAKIKCLPEISSVYRVHNNGIWSGINELKQLENELIFNQIIFNQLTKQQQLIIQGKQKTLISGLSYRIHKKNRLFRLLKRIQLTLKYKL